MEQHIKTGKKGEKLAVGWLLRNKFLIFHKNWRHRNWEIDVVAFKEDVLHFIEVKTRTSLVYGFPEDTVSQKKIGHMIDAADEYLQLYPKWTKIQFDILAITIKKKEVEYFFIEDVYL